MSTNDGLTQWKKMPIRNVYHGMYDGVHGTPPQSESGPIFLGIKNLTDDGKFDFSDIRHISEEDFARWTKRILPKGGDIVFTYEATLHRYAIIPRGFRGCLGRRLALIRPDNNKIVTKYLFYYFFSKEWRDIINKNIFSGATVDRIPIIHFPNFEITVPPLPTQEKIATTLSTYDDLIENNIRRIRILEEMAQAIYREWFVNFHFPGHEGIRTVESELGLIPEGWEVTSLDMIMDFQGGAQPPKEEWIYESQNGFIRMIQIRDYESDQYISFVKDTKDLRKCTPEDIMIARYGASVGRICFGLAGAYNVALVRVLPKKKIYREFLRAYLKEDFFQKMLIGMSGRTAQAGFNKTNLISVRLAFPNDDILLHQYEFLAKPILESILLMAEKNQNLRRSRDLLLPKLISGKIDVSGLDIRIPEAEV